MFPTEHIGSCGCASCTDPRLGLQPMAEPIVDELKRLAAKIEHEYLNERPIFFCANSHCGCPLGADHVTLITTAHVRRFCSVDCIAEGLRAHRNELSRIEQNEYRTKGTTHE